MQTCSECGRHLRASESLCPFCARPGPLDRFMNMAKIAMTPIVLAACYGQIPCDDDEMVDVDNDGSFVPASINLCELSGSVPADCDDGNADISATADEVCDDIDNDCDGGVDEGPEDTDANADCIADTDAADTDTDID